MTEHKTTAELEAMDALSKLAQLAEKAAAAKRRRSEAAKMGWAVRRAREWRPYGDCHCSPTRRFG